MLRRVVDRPSGLGYSQRTLAVVRLIRASVMASHSIHCTYHPYCTDQYGLSSSHDAPPALNNHNHAGDDVEDGELSILVGKESLYTPQTDYVKRLEVNNGDARARQKAVTWILKVQAHYCFLPETALLAANYLDRFLSCTEVQQWKSWAIQLASVTCLSLAAKMEERQVPLLLVLQVGEAEHAFEPRTIQRMELLLLSSLWNAVKKFPPGPVVECSNGFSNCRVSNAYGVFPDRSTCWAAQVVYPSTEDELLASVAEAVQKNQKMRVVTRYAHSIPKLVCPGGDSGLIISTRDLDYVVSVDKPSMRMTFQSGVTLKNLIDVAAREGLALPHCPYWLGVTLGGMLGTGAHGSSLFGKGSAVHEYVVGMRLVVPASPVEGYAKVVSLTEADEDLNATKVSLGVIGIISQVTLQLQPLFKRSITNVQRDDSDLESMIVQFGLEHEFGDVTWYPAQGKVVYRVDDRVPVNSDGNGVNDFIGFRSTSTALIATTRQAEEAEEAKDSADGKCASSIAQVTTILATGTGLKNNDVLYLGYPVIGYQNNMQAAGSCLSSPEDELLTACPWDPRIKGLFFFQSGLSISLSKIGPFLSDVRKLRDTIPSSLCGVELYSGFLMRYIKASSAYLGKQEDSVDIEMTYYRAKDPSSPRLYEDVLEEIEQMALMKYGALPHWGKNRNIAFDGVIKKYNKYDAFLSVKNQYDPNGLLSNDWTDDVLGIAEAGVIIWKDGCALEGLCVCSEDSHCAPTEGYFCKSGRIYSEARVCRFQGS